MRREQATQLWANGVGSLGTFTLTRDCVGKEQEEHTRVEMAGKRRGYSSAMTNNATVMEPVGI